jgi:predicted adenylyl cyclase CyaB
MAPPPSTQPALPAGHRDGVSGAEGLRAGLEIEVKFALPHLAEVRARLLASGARLLSPRTLEVNLRFDDPAGKLAGAGRVLRLRRDRASRLTYKAPGAVPEERVEIELEIDSDEIGRRFLEALGYRVVAAYEKFREVFALEDDHIMLDELPFGHFLETESSSIAGLRRRSDSLGLEWSRRITASYVALFEILRARAGREVPAATFEHWQDLPRPSVDDLEAAARELAPGPAGV